MKRQKCKTTVGKGSNRALPAAVAHTGARSSSSLSSRFHYRASDHIFCIDRCLGPKRLFTLSRIFNRLLARISRSFFLCGCVPSTHDLECRYRASAHIFTALRHMFLGSSLSFLPFTRTVSRQVIFQNLHNNGSATVIPPTFLPCFHTSRYRALNQHDPALPPTKFPVTTVLRPIKVVTNLLNSFSVQTHKVVSKFDLKNTTSLMMSFFLILVWSTPS
jgi:hypothetical protein